MDFLRGGVSLIFTLYKAWFVPTELIYCKKKLDKKSSTQIFVEVSVGTEKENTDLCCFGSKDSLVLYWWPDQAI